MPALYGAPAVSLHGVDQLIFCHPLLPRKLVLDAEEIVRVGPAQLGKDRAAGQLQPVGGVSKYSHAISSSMGWRVSPSQVEKMSRISASP